MPSQRGRDEVVGGCDKSDLPDYDSVEIPAKPPAEYHYTHRRAEILQLIKQAGHPRALNQSELADRYGVTQQTISKDFSRLAEHVDETLGADRALVSEAVYQRCIQELQNEGEWRDAARTLSEYNDWVREYKDLQEIQDRLDRLEAARERER